MQYINIKETEQDGKKVFVVPAIALKNKNNVIVQKIPSPSGTDRLIFNTLQEAEECIKRSGFSYILNDKSGAMAVNTEEKLQDNSYKSLIYNAIKDKVDSLNSNVSACAVMAISEFPNEEVFDILFNKIGEDNELIRKNAINGICKYPERLKSRIIKTLTSANWVQVNSAINCISIIIKNSNSEYNLEDFIEPLIAKTNHSNPIIQASAIEVLALVYKNYTEQNQ